ncbi:hypothetical protein ACHAWT_000035, partial [Skeletonema menzelii]
RRVREEVDDDDDSVVVLKSGDDRKATHSELPSNPSTRSDIPLQYHPFHNSSMNQIPIERSDSTREWSRNRSAGPNSFQNFANFNKTE